MRNGLPAGIDTTTGLRIFEGDEELYLKVLKSITENHEPDADALTRELAAGNETEASKIIHNIKGMAGNIGAEILFQAAQKAERSLKYNLPDKLKICGSFADEMRDIIGKLKIFFSDRGGMEPPPAPRRPGGSDDLLPILERLRTPLERRKAKQCSDICAELDEFAWPDLVLTELENLSAHVRRYRFREAQSVVERLNIILKADAAASWTYPPPS